MDIRNAIDEYYSIIQNFKEKIYLLEKAKYIWEYIK